MGEDSELKAIRSKKPRELEAKRARKKPAIGTRVAVPSMYPGGLQAISSGHFGHCDAFTIVHIEDGRMKEAGIVRNDHVDGSCMSPVNLLKSHGVQAVLVSGIGIRPLTFFRQSGIEVYAGAVGTVEFAVSEFISGNLKRASEADVCGHSYW